MKSQTNKNRIKRIALALSLCALIVWVILGTGTSLAWFTDTSKELSNIFHSADLTISASHRLDNGDWETIESKTNVFDNEALYEPGYTQVVYLKVTNEGSVPFEFKTAINVKSVTPVDNVYDEEIYLDKYLKFGVAIADTEAEMDEAVKTRALCKEIATNDFGNYATDTAILQPGKTSYIALVVRMPEEVDNVIKYRGNDNPKIELGIIASAEQLRK